MQIITCGETAIHVRIDGPPTGPVVMFANSLGTDMRVWDPLLPSLPAGLRLLRYDKRGHGLSDCPEAPYRMATLVEDAEAIATALGLSEILFVGLSIGGLIGQGLALRRPDLMRGLVLMDTAARIGTPQMWAERIAGLRSGGIGPMADGILERWFTQATRQDRATLAPWRNMLERTPLEGYIGCCAAIADTDYRREAAGLKLPVMAMVGSEDMSTPPAVVAQTAELYNAPCHVIENAGHLPCVEAPWEVARLLASFMEEID